MDAVLAAWTARQKADQGCLHHVQQALSEGVDLAVISSELARLPSPFVIPCVPDARSCEEADIAAAVRACTSKKDALAALYRRRIPAGDTRAINAIAQALTEELRQYEVQLDRGAANRYVKALHLR
ncbi:hypothetical protein IPZ58_27645 [Streptomyces roseoverticillatus]|uniref:hypothetical protein n=1 Tax=Streptomyces roseoverticillatus TaxID=66429 RepID=UPI001F3F67C3|nr:hypothetical protein [Streptomyces roseoverticillatus]MCF3105339.1 hypothetical protein [Streptomyces roseoverticillatus]